MTPSLTRCVSYRSPEFPPGASSTATFRGWRGCHLFRSWWRWSWHRVMSPQWAGRLWQWQRDSQQRKKHITHGQLLIMNVVFLSRVKWDSLRSPVCAVNMKPAAGYVSVRLVMLVSVTQCSYRHRLHHHCPHWCFTFIFQSLVGQRTLQCYTESVSEQQQSRSTEQQELHFCYKERSRQNDGGGFRLKKQTHLFGNISGLNPVLTGNTYITEKIGAGYIVKKLEVCNLLSAALHLTAH